MNTSRFVTLNSIVPDQPETWSDKYFLTFDMDWASDDVLSATLDLVEAQRIPATWFVTHNTPILDRLRENNLFELGIHPNFNKLLQGDASNGKNAEEVLERLMKIVPEALSIRSHGVTQSGVFHSLYQQFGLTHESNTFVPTRSEMILKPWYNFDGLVKAPFCWEDDIHHFFENTQSIKSIIHREGLKIFSFHPIHVILNSPDLTVYEESRQVHQNWPELQQFIHQGIGSQSYLKELFLMTNTSSVCINNLSITNLN